MNYTLDIELDLPRQKVIDLFNSSENLKKWQPDLISFEHISGEPGQAGAKSKMQYNTNNREVELIETVLTNDFPNSFSATYETKGVWNKLDNRFIVIDENRTKWEQTCEFKASGFIKILAFFMPGMFKKQSQKMMIQFKEFAENS